MLDKLSSFECWEKSWTKGGVYVSFSPGWQREFLRWQHRNVK